MLFLVHIGVMPVGFTILIVVRSHLVKVNRDGT